MVGPPEDQTNDIKRLQRCINDLVSVFALPAVWSGGGSSLIVRTLLDALLGILDLDLVYVRLRDSPGEVPIEIVRFAQSRSATAAPEALGAFLDRCLGPDTRQWAPQVQTLPGGGETSMVPLRLGLQGEIGVLVAGSRRSGFPMQTEKLILDVAANLAVVALHETRLLAEQKRLADVLDQRVAQRTLELAAANEELMKEIAERRRVEQRLRESELKLRQMTETIPEMLWSATSDGAIDYCNARVLDYTGFSTDEVMAGGWLKLLHPDDVDEAVRAWMSCVATGQPYRVEVRTFHAADHGYRWCVTSALPLRDEDGRIVKWHGTVVDMHDWKQAQERLRKTQAELAHITRVMTMGELTASIAHEVNQPLAAIITNGGTCLRLLGRPDVDIETVRKLAGRVVADARRAAEIIDGIRAMASRRASEHTSLALDDVIQESILFLRPEFQLKGVTVSLDLTPGLPRIAGDRTQLQQVIINLAINAAQAMTASGGRSILIRTTSQPGAVCCAIEDSGPGIEPTLLPRLFDSFFTTKENGMGMGLPICRSIIEAHDGQIHADNHSALGGARFSFTLPATAVHELPSAPSARKPLTAAANQHPRSFGGVTETSPDSGFKRTGQ
ncbi:ATP-binding protein [Bradyrhizobium sp.]|uniref:sensor histidine kinase n=1 Tax=Bradyrhizobium sp. TaxID=376 RepID=UPI003C625964